MSDSTSWSLYHGRVVSLLKVKKMATESFFEDMVMDTPESIANLEAFAQRGAILEHSGRQEYWSTADDVRRVYAAKKDPQ